VEQHLEPLAIAANVTQAAHCGLDTVLLTFGYLVIRYKAMADRDPEDAVGCNTILESLEKCWLASDQLIVIATVIINPFFRTTPFAPHPCFINARIKSILASLYSRFFKSEPSNMFYTELHESLMGTGQYSELEATCARTIHDSARKVL
jgi:hypothetical protein